LGRIVAGNKGAALLFFSPELIYQSISDNQLVIKKGVFLLTHPVDEERFPRGFSSFSLCCFPFSWNWYG